MKSSANLIVRPYTGCQPIDPRGIYQSRELFGFLVWRDIKVRYKQTILGGLWVVFQPLTAMLVFVPFFNTFAGIQTDETPYALFTLSRPVHWTFFANSVSRPSNSLAGNQGLVSKIYFRPVFMPLASIGALVLYLTIGLLLGLGFNPMSGMIRFRRSPKQSGYGCSLPGDQLFYSWQNCLSFGAGSGASRTSSAPEFPTQILGHNWRSASNVYIYARANAMKAVRRPTPNG